MQIPNKYWIKMICLVLLTVVVLIPIHGEASPKTNHETEEMKSTPPTGATTKKIILIIIDGLDNEVLKNTTAPNIKGLASGGLEFDKVVPAYPHDGYANIAGVLTGTAGYQQTGQKKQSTIFTLLEDQGIKTTLYDGTEKMNFLYQQVTNVATGSFNGKDSIVIDQAIAGLNENFTYFNVIILPQLKQKHDQYGAASPQYKKQITATDNDVGRLLHHLHAKGVFEETLFVVCGTGNTPSLMLKGPALKVGETLPPVSLMDIAPTIAHLNGLEMKQAEGMVLYNAIKSEGGRGETYLLNQRVRDLSIAHTEAITSLHRWEDEKANVKTQQDHLTKEKQTIQQAMDQRDQEIKKLTNRIFAMKAIGIVLLIIFILGYVIEYLILRKRFLMF